MSSGRITTTTLSPTEMSLGMAQRSLPLALFAGTLIVIVLYVGLNAVFLYTTPIEEMVGQLNVA